MKTSGKCVAYHEAGHAFANWHFKFKVKKISIIRHEDSLGHVVSKTGLHLRSLEYSTPSGARIGKLHTRVVTLLAGRAAQRRYQPRSVRSFHSISDRKAAAEILSFIHSKAAFRHVWNYLDIEARELVEKPMHWFVIKHLARELLKRKTMTGKEIEAVISDGFDKDFKKKIGQKKRATI